MKNQKKKSIIRKQITLAHITVLGMGLLWGCSLDTEKSNHQNLPPHPRIILNVENTKGMQERCKPILCLGRYTNFAFPWPMP